MKNFFYLSILCFALFTSCSEDDDEIVNNPPEETGGWSLTNVSGTLIGLDVDVDPGVIVWEFNQTDATVTVTNNSNDEMFSNILDPGTYPYVIQDNQTTLGNCPQVMVIDGINFGCYEVEGNTMTLSAAAADGYNLTFTQ